MRPLRVVHLVEALGTGGLERVVQALVRHSDGRRFAVEELFPGKYTVRAFRRGGGEVTLEHVALGAEVTLTFVPTGRMAGTVALQAGGAPQEFSATLAEPTTGYHRTDQFFRTGGAWSFAELPPGNYKLEVSAAEGTIDTQAWVLNRLPAMVPASTRSGTVANSVGAAI